MLCILNDEKICMLTLPKIADLLHETFANRADPELLIRVYSVCLWKNDIHVHDPKLVDLTSTYSTGIAMLLSNAT